MVHFLWSLQGPRGAPGAIGGQGPRGDRVRTSSVSPLLLEVKWVKANWASLSEPHTSVTALQDACVCMYVCMYVCLSVCLSAYVRPYTENFNWMNGNQGTRTFQSCTCAKALFCAMGLLNMTEDSSPCNSTPMNLQSARDRLQQERDCRADAKGDRKEGDQSGLR